MMRESISCLSLRPTDLIQLIDRLRNEVGREEVVPTVDFNRYGGVHEVSHGAPSFVLWMAFCCLLLL